MRGRERMRVDGGTAAACLLRWPPEMVWCFHIRAARRPATLMHMQYACRLTHLGEVGGSQLVVDDEVLLVQWRGPGLGGDAVDDGEEEGEELALQHVHRRLVPLLPRDVLPLLIEERGEGESGCGHEVGGKEGTAVSRSDHGGGGGGVGKEVPC